MTKRTSLAAIALIASGAMAPAFADDGDIPKAQILLEEARSFGKVDTRGEAAGDIAAKREQRRNDTRVLDANEQRWEQILKGASYGN